VAQDVIIREVDCGTDRGLTLELDAHYETSLFGRNLIEDVVVSGKVVMAAGTDIGDKNYKLLTDAGVSTVKVRSVLTCDSKFGQCAMCYGRSMASGKLVDVGGGSGAVGRNGL
jgi:DNA-directed RNA polymerase subunit beta'